MVFTPKETRGVVVYLIIIVIIVGSKIFYDHIARESQQEVGEDCLTVADSVVLFEFDPNTVTLPELRRLGLSKSEAVSVIRSREYGKVFRIKEDLLTLYGVSDSLYYALEPYINIGEEFRLKRREEYSASQRGFGEGVSAREERERLSLSSFLVDTVGANYLVAVGALSARQAAVFVRWRDLSGIRDMSDLRKCYVVSDSVAAMLEPYVIFAEVEPELAELVDLNSADSVALCSVYGIGGKSAAAIVEYRKRLGGFHSVEQLSELKMVTESNYEKIIQQISCNSCDISKIDVNFAPAKILHGHPYIAPKSLRKLLKTRELKGGWSTVEEMIDDNIFTREEAHKVRPYLLFEEFEGSKEPEEPFFNENL